MKILQIYMTFSLPPFYVFLKAKNPRNNEEKKVSFINVARKLYKSNVHYQECIPQSNNCWKLSFESKSAANEVIRNPYLKSMGFEIFIPKYLLFRKGIIRGHLIRQWKKLLKLLITIILN